MIARECAAIGAQQIVNCLVDLLVLPVWKQVLDRDDLGRIADEPWLPDLYETPILSCQRHVCDGGITHSASDFTR